MPLPITLSTPLADGELLLEGMTCAEGLSQIGDWQLALLSDKVDIEPERLLGQRVSVGVRLRDETVRHFNGYVTRFGIGTSRGRMHGYHATLAPWLWFLTRTSDCRIFQQQSVPDIVKTVFDEHACASYQLRLSREYREREYCVQYRETDFHFVARLLEDEGIYWYFEHAEDAHTLVLADSLAAHEIDPGSANLPYFENRGMPPPDRDFVGGWRVARGVRTGHVATSSFDFERPATSLLVDKQRPRAHQLADYELFDYAGAYSQRADGEQYLDNWIDELHTRYETLRGVTNARTLACGRLMSLSEHPRDDQNAEYLVTATAIRLQQGVGESAGAHHEFSCDFSAIPAAQQFRPARATAKPAMRGPQTAMVVGPAGEEIHTDRYGRVKVQFHWDRYGQRDENSSCWIRVSHPWAGRGWGAVSIPRIGQEVIVDFLEGDPDQPIITGRVYNGDAMPPFELPAGAVVSGLRSNTHKGQGYNAMTMDDTAGSEKISIHAQHDMQTTVEHDDTQAVLNDRVIRVEGNHTESIKGDTSITVTDGTLTHDVATGTAQYHVKGDLTQNYDGRQTTTVTGAVVESYGATQLTEASGDITVNSAGSITIEALNSITLQVGSHYISINSAGQIAISATNVVVNASSVAKVHAETIHTEASQSNSMLGNNVLSQAAVNNVVKGAMVMLNP